MRDWNRAKDYYSLPRFRGGNCAEHLLEAIAEIEQLRLEVVNTIGLKEYDAEQFKKQLAAEERETIQYQDEIEQLRAGLEWERNNRRLQADLLGAFNGRLLIIESLHESLNRFPEFLAQRAEIEQLRQERAELVEALTILDALMDFGEELEPGGYYCYTDTVAVNRACKTAHQLLAKLEGGEPNE